MASTSDAAMHESCLLVVGFRRVSRAILEDKEAGRSMERGDSCKTVLL